MRVENDLSEGGKGLTMNNAKNKILYVEMSPAEHGVLRVEAAISNTTMCDIVRQRLIAPLAVKHKKLFVAGESFEK